MILMGRSFGSSLRLRRGMYCQGWRCGPSGESLEFDREDQAEDRARPERVTVVSESLPSFDMLMQ
jgi:hypothetical protein